MGNLARTSCVEFECARVVQAPRGSSPSTRALGSRLLTAVPLAALLLGALTVPSSAAVTPSTIEGGNGEGSEALKGAAAKLELRYGRKKSVLGEKISTKLSPAVRAALNEWAETAERLDLSVAVGERAECVVMGRCDKKLLAEAVEWVDDTWDLMADVVPEGDGWHDATLVFLFDEQGVRSDAWKGLFDEFVRREAIGQETAEHMVRDPGSLTLRQVPAFIQPTWDMAGNAAAGDDEFRLGNEVAHNLTQCLLTERFGEVPETLRWGMGYVAEQRLFRSIYHFDARGFVATGSHFDWPKKTGKALNDSKRDDAFSLARMAKQGTAGQAEKPQMVTWATLDYMTHKRPEELAALLGDLSRLHTQGSPYGFALSYAGDDDQTIALLDEHFGAIDQKALIKHVKRVK